MRILFIAKQAPHGGRFHVPLAIGLQRLGHEVIWLGGQVGGLEMWPEDLNVVPRYTLEYLEDVIDTADLVVLIEHIDKRVKSVVQLLNEKRPDYVYLSGFDYRAGCNKVWGPEIGLNPRVYFKREAHPNFPDIIPFSGDAVNPFFRNRVDSKQSSVCALLANNDGVSPGNRSRVVATCRNFERSNARLLLPGQHLSLARYIECLNQAVVSVSAWGVGYLCYRDMEVLSANTIPAIQRNPSRQYEDIRGCILYSSPGELQAKVELVLGSIELQGDMLVQKSISVALRYTPEAKARKFLDLAS